MGRGRNLPNKGLPKRVPTVGGKTIPVLRTLVKQGDVEATFHLATAYSDGVGVKVDHRQAAQLYKKAAELGSAKAAYNYAAALHEGEGVEKDVEGSIGWLRMSADRGFVEAQGSLAYAFAKGNGTEVNLEEAARWYREAAEQGHVSSIVRLGTCYLKGNGVEKDVSAAVHWFRKGVEKKDPCASLNLGLAYYHGVGVEQDNAQALSFLFRAARAGLRQANLALAELSLRFEADKKAKEAEERGEDPEAARKKAREDMLARVASKKAGDPISISSDSDLGISSDED